MREFLADKPHRVDTEVNAKKNVIEAAAALDLVKQADQVYAARGKKVVHFDLRRDDADEDALRKVVLGPTGNLRAPTLRMGSTLVIGFDEGTYQKLFS